MELSSAHMLPIILKLYIWGKNRVYIRAEKIENSLEKPHARLVHLNGDFLINIARILYIIPTEKKEKKMSKIGKNIEKKA